MTTVIRRAHAPLLEADTPMQHWAALTDRVRAHTAEQRCSLRWMALIALPPVVQRLAGSCYTRPDRQLSNSSQPEEGWNRLGRYTGLSLAAFVMITKMNRPGDRNLRGISAVVRVLGWQVANTALLLAPRDR